MYQPQSRKAASLLYGLLGAGGMTAADLALIQAGNSLDGESQMTGSDQMQAVAAALAGLGMGAGAGAMRFDKNQLHVEVDPDGNARVSVQPSTKQKAAEAAVAAAQAGGDEAAVVEAVAEAVKGEALDQTGEMAADAVEAVKRQSAASLGEGSLPMRRRA